MRIENQRINFLLQISKCFRYQANPLSRQARYTVRAEKKTKKLTPKPHSPEGWRLVATKTPGY